MYAVKKLDREKFFLECRDKSLETNHRINFKKLSHIAIQIKDNRYKTQGFSSMFYNVNGVNEFSKVIIYENISDFDNCDTFIFRNKEDTQIIYKQDDKLAFGRIYDSNEFYFLWHCKKSLFITKQDDSYSFSRYIGGVLIKENLSSSIKAEVSSHIKNIKDFPNIVSYDGGFLSVCIPDTPITKEHPSTCGQWALFRVGRSNPKDVSYQEDTSSRINQLTPFVLEEAPIQLKDNYGFICHGAGSYFLVKYDSYKRPLETNDLSRNAEEACRIIRDNNITTSMKLHKFKNLCFQGCLKATSKEYNTLELREDGMYDVSTNEGFGLCDEDMNEIIPAKYGSIIYDLTPLMIVEKNERYGVVNNVGKDIVPCAYDSIKISKDNITIWNVETDFDPILEEQTSHKYLGFLNDSTSSDNIIEDGYFIVCINKNITGSLFFKNKRWIPNYYSGQRVLGSYCDVYLPNGKLIACYERVPAGGIHYFKDYNALMRYEECFYDVDYGEFYNHVQLDFFKLDKRLSMLEQAFLLNDRYFLASDGKGHIGIGSNGSEESQSEKPNDCSWALPAIYSKLSLPLNDIIYAFRYNDNKQIVDIIDIITRIKLILSIEIKSDFYTELNTFTAEHISLEIKNRFIKKDDGNKLVFFPFERYYDDGGGSEWVYGDDGSYKDAFEDDPESSWGILD